MLENLNLRPPVWRMNCSGNFKLKPSWYPELTVSLMLSLMARKSFPAWKRGGSLNPERLAGNWRRKA